MAAMTTASRTSGVAPLAVFFDAVDDVEYTPPPGGTTGNPTFAWTSGVTQPADMEGSLFTWDFGDANPGTWAVSGRSKNTATGYCTAHVYETPGTYTVTLWVTDSITGVRTQYDQTITVSSPDALVTRYVSAAGVDSNPGTLAQPYLTLARGMQDIQNGTAKRLLFRRGDTFRATTYYNMTQPGPGMIGAYGTGNRPIVTFPYLGDGINVFRPYGTGVDWRFCDLDFRPDSPTSQSGAIGPPNEQRAVNFLQLRIGIRNSANGLGWGDYWSYYPNADPPHYGRNDNSAYTQNVNCFLVDCDATAATDYGSYVILGYQGAIMGCVIEGGTTHTLRVLQEYKATIAHNSLTKPGGTRHCLKMYGGLLNDGARPLGSWITITDNYAEGTATAPWLWSLGSPSGVDYEIAPVSHFVFERNFTRAGSGAQAIIESEASHVVVRNNISDMSACTGGHQVWLWIWRNPGVPQPDDIRIYNNTSYANTPRSGAYLLSSQTTITNLRIRNEVYAGPSGTVGLLYIGAAGYGAGPGYAADHNLLTVGGTPTAASLFTNPAAHDVSLRAGSAAIDAGATLVEVREDYARADRLVPYDLGAFQFGSSGAPPTQEPIPVALAAVIQAVARAQATTRVSPTVARMLLHFTAGQHTLRIEQASGATATVAPLVLAGNVDLAAVVAAAAGLPNNLTLPGINVPLASLIAASAQFNVPAPAVAVALSAALRGQSGASPALRSAVALAAQIAASAHASAPLSFGFDVMLAAVIAAESGFAVDLPKVAVALSSQINAQGGLNTALAVLQLIGIATRIDARVRMVPAITIVQNLEAVMGGKADILSLLRTAVPYTDGFWYGSHRIVTRNKDVRGSVVTKRRK